MGKIFILSNILYGVALGLWVRILNLPHYCILIVIGATATISIYRELKRQRSFHASLRKYVEAHLRASKIKNIRQVYHYKGAPFEVSINYKQDDKQLWKVFTFKTEIESREFFCEVVELMHTGKV